MFTDMLTMAGGFIIAVIALAILAYVVPLVFFLSGREDRTQVALRGYYTVKKWLHNIAGLVVAFFFVAYVGIPVIGRILQIILSITGYVLPLEWFDFLQIFGSWPKLQTKIRYFPHS